MSTSSPLPQHLLFFLRVVIAIFLLLHGKEVFDAARMQEYAKWDMFTAKTYLPYIGKAAEFIAGVLLLAGLFTRTAAVITIGTFLYITFFIGNGKFWMEDQHPFLFVLFGLLFLVAGPGSIALDNKLFRKKQSNY
jgi:putative oxidoreductase